MQVLNLHDRACKRERTERCPNVAVRWQRAVQVGGGEERRLGGGCGESFLNESSEVQTNAWELQFCSDHKK